MNTWYRLERAAQAFLRSKNLGEGRIDSARSKLNQGSRKSEAFVGQFITCCEEDRLEELLKGKVFHIHDGNVI